MNAVEIVTPQINYLRRQRDDPDFIEWYNRSPENKLKQVMANRKYRQKTKLEVLSHYSGGIPKCACCDETIMDFLTIDHIHNDGAEERKKNKLIGSGTGFYLWLRRNNYPEGDYQVLCWNCQMSKKLRGYCIHKGEEK